MSGLRLDGKIVIITGGASGIGAESARLFTEHGAKVVIVDLQEEMGQNVTVSIGRDKGSFYRCDITNETEVENAVMFTVEKYGKLDVLFSNAGVMEQPGSFLDLDLEQFDRTMAVNVRGPAAFIKHAARAMMEKGTRGSIICTTSTAAEIINVFSTPLKVFWKRKRLNIDFWNITISSYGISQYHSKGVKLSHGLNDAVTTVNRQILPTNVSRIIRSRSKNPIHAQINFSIYQRD